MLRPHAVGRTAVRPYARQIENRCLFTRRALSCPGYRGAGPPVERKSAAINGGGVKAIYPGTFDPVTNGHLDVIERAAAVFGELVVAVAINLDKNPTFDTEERVAMIRESCGHLSNVEVISFPGLLVDLATTIGAQVIVKGLRAVSDFEYEFQMAQMNRKLNPNVETVLLPTASNYAFLSSSLVKQIARLGADVSDVVPPPVMRRLQELHARAASGPV